MYLDDMPHPSALLPRYAVPRLATHQAMDRDALAQTILNLENGLVEPVVDPALAYALGHHVKPIIDRIAGDGELGLADLESAAARTNSEDMPGRRRRAIKKRHRLDEPMLEIDSLAVEDKARWIFMERFITLDQHEAILGIKFTAEERKAHLKGLDQLLATLFVLPQVAKLMAAANLAQLQEIFASTLLIFRNARIADDQPCNLENLRHNYPDYFYKRRKTPNWYEAQDFYTEPIAGPHWALCDFDLLNCTLRRPERKLLGYARQWSLPAPYVQQKSVLDDIYDRIVSGEALQEHLFEQNCSACTSTRYKPRNRGPLRMVYIVQKERKIAIHGKSGLPHWKTSRRLWPGVYPAVVAKSQLATAGDEQ